MAMANSVEGRYPFLDHRVVEFATRIPPQFRLKGLKEKYILKQIARGRIPSELIDRPKQPYRAPISKCFFSYPEPQYVDELLSETAIEATAYFDYKKVSRLAAKCRQQDGSLLSERENMGIVAILSTQLLHHMFVENFPYFTSNEPKEVRVFS